jgi:hypothetical protein
VGWVRAWGSAGVARGLLDALLEGLDKLLEVFDLGDEAQIVGLGELEQLQKLGAVQ